ncbi:MAG: TolC family protein [Kiritimatiellia bacterium]
MSWSGHESAAGIPSASSAPFQASANTRSALARQIPVSDDTGVPAPSAEDGPLALADCMGIALARNPQTRGSWQAAKAAAARVGEERAAYFPSANLRAEAARGRSVLLDSERESETRDTYTGGIDVSVLLFDGGARRARVAGAEAALLEADFRHNAALQDVAISVQESYYELLGAQWFLTVAQETVKRTQYQLDMALARHGAGVVTRSDVLRAETQRADAELLLVQARNGVRISQGRLARTMGLPIHTAFEIVELSGDLQQQELPRIEQLFDEAARQRPELQAALAHIAATRSEIAGSRAAYWPTLSAGVSAGRKDTEFVPEQDEWSAGLSLRFPLFDGFERGHRTRRTQADLARAMADHANLLQGIELEVWTGYWRLIESADAVDAATRLTASAGESARLAEGEYKNGIISIVGLIDAQTAQTEAERCLVQARLDWYTAKARFERAVGQSLVEQTKTSAKESE